MPTPDADPRPTELTMPFWEGCRRGVLALQHCRGCARYIHFPRRRCPHCGSREFTWTEVPRTGTLVTFTTVYRSFAPGFERDAPYVVAVAELDVAPEVRIIANIDRPEADLTLNSRVVVGFTPRPGFGAVPTLMLE
jgi:hypothetical protein